MNRIELETYMTGVGRAARAASSVVANTSTATKNTALFALARRIREQRAVLQQANAQDVNSARAGGLAAPMVERLKLTDSVVELMAQGCEQIAALPDPVGEVTNLRYRPSGIRVGQMRVPLGVFGMVYESRPNVTIDAASLAIKSGNACVLRGGSEAMQSNLALVNLVRAALEEVHLPVDTVQMITTADREAVGRLIAMPEFVDVLIPRGGKSLIERVSRDAKVPVIKHLDGNCHIYVDISADFELAVRVIDNAKTQKFGVCNALESLLVHTAIAGNFLPRLGPVFAAKGIEMRCDLASKTALHPVTGAKLVDATEADWSEEYLAPIVSIKLVPDLDAAIAHINSYGSHHTDTILTEHHPSAMRFLRAVDSATVMINASTRFADGFEFGLGAEIGISTDKFHARGPVGLEGLTCMKWIVLGHGEVRA